MRSGYASTMQLGFPNSQAKMDSDYSQQTIVPVSSIEDGEDPCKMALNGCTEPQAAPTLSWIHEEAGISCGDLQNESEGK